jgi:Xaa-Pro aminopeptidase
MRHAPIDSQLFVQNRARLKALLAPNSLVAVNANDLLPANADAHLRLVPNTDLFYLTGVEQEESILLLCPDAADERMREILFLRETSELIAIWEGHKLTKEEAQQVSGIRRVEWLSAFPMIFHKLMCEVEHVYLNTNEHKRAEVVVETREARFVKSVQERYPLHDYRRLARLMHALRVIKSPAEVALIQHACRQRGAFAYNPIIAAGKNACVLHYLDNQLDCRDGDVLLLDVAASYANYNSDLTRTIPVNGRFTKRQRQVYNAVLRVLRSQIAGLTPGKKWQQWQDESEEAVARECVDLGLLKPRDLKKRVEDPMKKPVKKFYMHGCGHPIGLDVHDLGFLTEPFAPGWVMTVEPAIYLPEEGFAVRLENDVLITETGVVDLMAHIPIEADDIEALMAGKKGRK